MLTLIWHKQHKIVQFNFIVGTLSLLRKWHTSVSDYPRDFIHGISRIMRES